MDLAGLQRQIQMKVITPPICTLDARNPDLFLNFIAKEILTTVEDMTGICIEATWEPIPPSKDDPCGTTGRFILEKRDE
jgi:hypothetical protein